MSIDANKQWNMTIKSSKELHSFIDKLLSSRFEDITIWSKNSFITDSDKWWCCIISINSDDISYMYSFRYNVIQEKLYGSPFKINDDVTSIVLNYSSNPSLYNMFEEVVNLI